MFERTLVEHTESFDAVVGGLWGVLSGVGLLGTIAGVVAIQDQATFYSGFLYFAIFLLPGVLLFLGPLFFLMGAALGYATSRFLSSSWSYAWRRWAVGMGSIVGVPIALGLLPLGEKGVAYAAAIIAWSLTTAVLYTWRRVRRLRVDDQEQPNPA